MLRHITPICVASTSVSAISQTPWFAHFVALIMSVQLGVFFEADTMFRYSFKILPDRLKLIQLYPCGSLRKSVSFIFGARVGHFEATPQNDLVGIWSRDLGVMVTLSVRQKMHFFRAFITLRSQFHLHYRSQRALMEIVSKITPNLGVNANPSFFMNNLRQLKHNYSSFTHRHKCTYAHMHACTHTHTHT